MKLPPFTLVHDPEPDPERPRGEVTEEWLRKARDDAPSVAAVLTEFPFSLRETLLASTYGVLPVLGHAAATALSVIVAELRRQPDVVRVGVWDLDAHVGRLPAIIEALNAPQPAFTFFEVQASIPAGLVSAPARVVKWASQNADISAKDRREMRDNMIAEDFYRHAERVRGDLSLDYLIGLTPKMVAGDEDDEIFWNHFSWFSSNLVLASVYELPKFAREAGRPYEALVGGVMTAQLLVAIEPKLTFHANRGCLFDYNEDRASIVKAAKRARIETSCLNKIRADYREAAAKLVEALRDYTGDTSE